MMTFLMLQYSLSCSNTSAEMICSSLRSWSSAHTPLTKGEMLRANIRVKGLDPHLVLNNCFAVIVNYGP